jgi:hypothetical protein
MKIIKLFIIALVVFRSSGLAPRVQAATDFTTSFESLYLVQETGDTHVTHHISLKNNLAHIYATEYTIAISGEDLSNIKASDEISDIEIKSVVQNGITSIHLLISRPAIGKDQIKTISLSYNTGQVVEKIGDTTTINIPRLEKANESQSYKRIVKIKGITTSSEYIYPPANSKYLEDDYTVYNFDGHDNDSLSLLFGDSVTYELSLTYELKNNELKKATTELALPGDTAYQSIILSSLDPAPLDIALDENGNWMARYNVDSKSTISVKALLFVTVYPVPKLVDPSSTSYVATHKSKYWQTDSAIVSDLATKLKTPQNIYNYLVENYVYNYAALNSKVERLGAVSALSSPSNVLCTEFTDTFVALARSLNIPSREINGFGYTKNLSLQPQSTTSDILHAWPEYYNADKKTWVSVDPTWGNTTGGVNFFDKLDYSHITFVRHGVEDSYPLPAGAYKSNPSDKFVSIKVATAIPERVSRTEIVGDKIVNTGNVAITTKELGYLPPYGSTKRLDSKHLSLYDKIKQICAKLLSIF